MQIATSDTLHRPKQSQWVLVLIGCGKLLKAAMLLFFAFRLHYLLRSADPDSIEAWFRHFRVDPHNVYVHRLISRLTGISDKQLRELRIGSFVYATLFAIEGTGLVLRQHWAEYFTAISTGLLLPLEIYEIFHGHHHAIKILVLLANAAIVVYLVARLRNERANETN
jgi:uncharacterized membrane protein (DUF2068 family)